MGTLLAIAFPVVGAIFAQPGDYWGVLLLAVLFLSLAGYSMVKNLLILSNPQITQLEGYVRKFSKRPIIAKSARARTNWLECNGKKLNPETWIWDQITEGDYRLWYTPVTNEVLAFEPLKTRPTKRSPTSAGAASIESASPHMPKHQSKDRQQHPAAREKAKMAGESWAIEGNQVRFAIQSFDVGEPFAFADLKRICPDVSRKMIRDVLYYLRSQGQVECTGRGRAARWKRSR
jgi:hypothetical protein